MIGIRDMYNSDHRILQHGVDGYQAYHRYIDSYDKNQLSLPKRQLKIGNFLEEYEKCRTKTPGPAFYDSTTNLWPQKSTRRTQKPKYRSTIFGEMIRRTKRQKKPAPNHYKLGKSVEEMDKERKKNSRKKFKYQDRLTYLDGIMYQSTQIPGVGKYNIKTRQKMQGSLKKDNPQMWRKKHEAAKKKKMPTQPNMRTYYPKEAKRYERKITKKGLWNQKQRFYSEKSMVGPELGPGKYLPIDNWNIKKSLIAPRMRPKSAYYD